LLCPVLIGFNPLPTVLEKTERTSQLHKYLNLLKDSGWANARILALFKGNAVKNSFSSHIYC
jgi:hypothetical protein